MFQNIDFFVTEMIYIFLRLKKSIQDGSDNIYGSQNEVLSTFQCENFTFVIPHQFLLQKRGIFDTHVEVSRIFQVCGIFYGLEIFIFLKFTSSVFKRRIARISTTSRKKKAEFLLWNGQKRTPESAFDMRVSIFNFNGKIFQNFVVP